MSTHLVGSQAARAHPQLSLASHWTWLATGYVIAFAIPFLLTDVVALNRDLFYGLYALAVVALFAGWSRSTGYDLRAAARRRLPLAVGLGLAMAAVLAAIVVRSEAATARPGGLDLAAALAWRGVLYGVTDGLLLSAFPILVVFAAFAGSKQSDHLRGKLVIGAAALLASIAMTAVYHLGYNDFRSAKLRKPVLGDTIWSVPTLVTLNPVGAPIAHVGLHVSAVLHSYDTEVFLPPHSR
jgi:hypothetical protein